MFLFITEDGALYKGYSMTESEKLAVAEGVLDIIAIGDAQPVQWFGNKWHDIPWAPEEQNSGT